MTVAARVAQEMGSGLGDEVGYAIRFEDVCSKVCSGHTCAVRMQPVWQPVRLPVGLQQLLTLYLSAKEKIDCLKRLLLSQAACEPSAYTHQCLSTCTLSVAEQAGSERGDQAVTGLRIWAFIAAGPHFTCCVHAGSDEDQVLHRRHAHQGHAGGPPAVKLQVCQCALL